MAAISRDLQRHWGWIAARGVFAILFGILALAWPQIALLTLVVLFGIYVLMDGIAALTFSARGGTVHGGRTWPMVLAGVAGIAAGVVAFGWPEITAVALLYIIAFWALFRGVFELIAAFQLHDAVGGSMTLGFAGVLSIVFGFMLLAWPAAGIMAMIWLVALYAVVIGVISLVAAYQLRNMEHRRSSTRHDADIPTGHSPA